MFFSCHNGSAAAAAPGQKYMQPEWCKSSGLPVLGSRSDQSCLWKQCMPGKVVSMISNNVWHNINPAGIAAAPWLFDTSNYKGPTATWSGPSYLAVPCMSASTIQNQQQQQNSGSALQRWEHVRQVRRHVQRWQLLICCFYVDLQEVRLTGRPVSTSYDRELRTSLLV